MKDLFKDWRVERGPTDDDTLSTVTNEKVHIEIRGDVTTQEQAEIAYLIAAAPELLEALQAAAEYIGRLPYDVLPKRHNADIDAIYAQCRAAIAKAEGRSTNTNEGDQPFIGGK